MVLMAKFSVGRPNASHPMGYRTLYPLQPPLARHHVESRIGTGVARRAAPAPTGRGTRRARKTLASSDRRLPQKYSPLPRFSAISFQLPLDRNALLLPSFRVRPADPSLPFFLRCRRRQKFGQREGRAVLPEALQIIKPAGLLLENMDDHRPIIHEDPGGGVIPLRAQGADPLFTELRLHITLSALTCVELVPAAMTK